MSNAGRWLAESLLNHFLRNVNTAAPPQHFLRLFISNPTSEDIGTEVQGGGYVPQAITFTAPEAVDGFIQITNAAEIRFPVATADWGNISDFTIHTAASGGNMIAFTAVAVPKLIEEGDEAKFIAGSIIIRVAGDSITASGDLLVNN